MGGINAYDENVCWTISNPTIRTTGTGESLAYSVQI